MTDNFEREVIERLTKIETKLDSVEKVPARLSKVETEVELLKDNVQDLQDTNKVFRGALITISCALIVAIIRLVLSF